MLLNYAWRKFNTSVIALRGNNGVSCHLATCCGSGCVALLLLRLGNDTLPLYCSTNAFDSLHYISRWFEGEN